MTKKALSAHPIADLFPMMSEDQLTLLAESIASQGLLEPIVLHEGQILDGRNRHAACVLAEVEPTFVEFNGAGNPFEFVLGRNVDRRDLTAGQRALVAARALPEYEADAKERMAAGGRGKGRVANTLPSLKSVEVAARRFRVGSQSVQRANAILAEARDLADQISAQQLGIEEAWGVVLERRDEAKERKRIAATAAELAEAVSEGRMTMEEAVRDVAEREAATRRDEATHKQHVQITSASLAQCVRYADVALSDHDGRARVRDLFDNTESREPYEVSMDAIARAAQNLSALADEWKEAQ